MSERSIVKLDTSVVNRIAAGEIIVQPANALKEMLENSIDAGSTMVDVLVKEGGLKLLQITDNGCGIAQEDLGLLCERFATSKLKSFDDLSLIATYGFRGEALASISHISRLSVVSKVDSSPLAYKAYYLNSKLCSPKFKADPASSDPKPVAGKNGTQITVEDLFYNLASRLRAVRTKGDEWARILDILGRYAVHSAGVGFSCKKVGDPVPAIVTRPHAPLKERIRTVFGTSVASELIEFDFDGTDFGVSKLRGAVTGFNYSNKRKITPVFFINNRLVLCDPLHRAVKSVFELFLPKGTFPFVYLSLDIASQNLDVNVHPTKREVRFLFEDEIIEWVCGKIHDVLSTRVDSRSFKQSTMKKREPVEAEEVQVVKKYRQENKLVRVDATQLKINAFIRVYEPESQKGIRASEGEGMDDNESTFMTQGAEETTNMEEVSPQRAEMVYTFSNRAAQTINLDSVLELREEVSNSICRPLTNIFNNFVYVGIVDSYKRLCCFQYDVKLYLCDYGAVLNEFYYQEALSGFGNYGEYVLQPPLPLSEILAPVYEQRKDVDLMPMDDVIGSVASMADMFLEYFQIRIEDGVLYQLPILLKDVIPSMLKLPYFIYRLGTKVNYEDEKQCLLDIMQQLALLHIPDKVQPGENESVSFEVGQILETVVFPAVKKRFIAPEFLLPEVVQVADLPGLYRVFERC